MLYTAPRIKCVRDNAFFTGRSNDIFFFFVSSSFSFRWIRWHLQYYSYVCVSSCVGNVRIEKYIRIALQPHVSNFCVSPPHMNGVRNAHTHRPNDKSISIYFYIFFFFFSLFAILREFKNIHLGMIFHLKSHVWIFCRRLRLALCGPKYSRTTTYLSIAEISFPSPSSSHHVPQNSFRVYSTYALELD